MKLQCCEIARDKLLEARFFLTRLKRSQGRQPSARYYASATVSAARSVTLVLQAELRATYGDRFEDWWINARATLAGQLNAFSLVRDARNTVQKEGNFILRPVLRRDYADGPVSRLRVRLDAIMCNSADYSFDVRPGKEVALTPITDEALAGKSRADIDAIFEAKIDLMKDLESKLANTQEVLRTSPGVYEFLEGYEDLTFAEVLSQLEGFFNGLEALLDSADETFGLEVPGVTPAA